MNTESVMWSMAKTTGHRWFMISLAYGISWLSCHAAMYKEDNFVYICQLVAILDCAAFSFYYFRNFLPFIMAPRLKGVLWLRFEKLINPLPAVELYIDGLDSSEKLQDDYS